MKALPTLEGGLRIETADASDWDFLRCIIHDANGCESDLASRLGSLISPEAGGEDWEELVVPDLREEFQDELAQVHATIETAAHSANNGGGPLWIRPADAFAWYGSLNQARLALEERYQFTELKNAAPETVTHEQIAAYRRSKFYHDIQDSLLEHVLH